MSSFFSAKKILLFGFIFVLLLAIPLTVYLIQKQQEVRSRAVAATTLSFVPATQNINVGQNAVFDIYLDPGSNQVSFAKLTISYDDQKLTAGKDSLTANTNQNKLSNVLDGPTNITSEPSVPATISITLSVGADPTAVITSKTKIATLTLAGKVATESTGTTVQFVPSQTQILSIGSSDQLNENVLLLSSLSPATVVISGSSTGTSNTPPTCSGLAVDRSTAGTAPYLINFTASGSDSNGTITKATFNFGNGSTQDVTQSGGIGTNSVNIQIPYTYNNQGSFKAFVVLTDNNGATSDPNACTQNLTITAGTAGGGATGGQISQGTPSATVVPTISGAAPQSPTPIPSIAPAGPSNKLIGAGIVGVVLSIIGGLLLFSL